MKVTIIIIGGAVQAVQKDAGIELSIIDYDTKECPIEMKYEAVEEINEIDFEVLKKELN